MPKKQWKEQAESYLNRILGLLKGFEEVDYIGQEPYKGKFFALFSDAFRSGFCFPGRRFDEQRDRFVSCKSQRPLISGDAIWEYAKSHRWVHCEMTGQEKRYRNLEIVRTGWDEWIYAWQHYPPPRKYVRRTRVENE